MEEIDDALNILKTHAEAPNYAPHLTQIDCHVVRVAFLLIIFTQMYCCSFFTFGFFPIQLIVTAKSIFRSKPKRIIIFDGSQRRVHYHFRNGAWGQSRLIKFRFRKTTETHRSHFIEPVRHPES